MHSTIRYPYIFNSDPILISINTSYCIWVLSLETRSTNTGADLILFRVSTDPQVHDHDTTRGARRAHNTIAVLYYITIYNQ
jgi:hypothetical protein